MSILNSVQFTCTALNNSNKTGKLMPDADGYYEPVLGGLNVFNSSGEFYTAEGARELFSSSSLMRKRIERGRLRGEYGHPKQLPGQSDEAFMTRILQIHEDRICAHFKDIYLDDTRVKADNGTPIIAIIGKVKPSGPYGNCLRESLENPHENVCFSIRAFTDDNTIRGIRRRTLKTIVTWDYVNDPGIASAEKWKSPSLENLALVDRTFSRGQIERAMSSNIDGVAQEAARMNVDELFSAMGWERSTDGKPAFMKW